MSSNKPFPSSDLDVFKDNSLILDNFVNSQENEHPDRFGRKRPTITGIIKEAFNVRTDISNMNETLIGQSRWDVVPKNTSLSLGGDNGALNKQAQALFNRTVMLKVHARETLRRTYLEVGLNLVEGSFEQGGTLQSVTDVLLEEKTGKVYSWTGSFPKDISSNTLPESSVNFSESTNKTFFNFTIKPVTWSGFSGGADPSGNNDSTKALNDVYTAANSDGKAIIIPKGIYKVGNELRKVNSDTLWLSRDFNSGVSASDTARKTPFLITVGNPNEPVLSSEHTRVGMNITAIGRGAQHIDCIRASLINESTDGQGNTAVYGSSISKPNALWSAALHGETKHEGGTSIAISSENASYSTLGSFYGQVINNTTGTAAEFNPSTGTQVVAHPSATALYITGGTTRGEMGQWVRGIRFSPLSMRANGTLIRDESSCSQGFWSLTSSRKLIADILLEGSAGQAGIIIQGNYDTGNGIRLSSGIGLAFEETGKLKIKYDKSVGQLGFYNGDLSKVSLDLTQGAVFINTNKVLADRKTGFQRLTGQGLKTSFDTETATTLQIARRLKALEDALHAETGHGLIGN